MPGPVSTVSNNMPLLLGFALAVGAVSVGVWGAKGTRGLNGFGGRTVRRPALRGHSRRRGLGGPIESRDLMLYIENDGDLYRQQMQPIRKNLATKMAKGVFDRTKAEKLWMYLVENGAKKYVKDMGGQNEPWHKFFTMEDRKRVARELTDSFIDEQKHGEYDYLLPKKYKKSA